MSTTSSRTISRSTIWERTTSKTKRTTSKTTSKWTTSTTIDRTGERRVVLALGGNVGRAGEIVAGFVRALRRLAEGPLIDLHCAPLYRTAAVFDLDDPGESQADFVNTVATARLAAHLEPGPAAARHLLGWCKHLEAEAGRHTSAVPDLSPSRPPLPRPLDLDLLLLGTLRLQLPATAERLAPGDWPGEITVPHPRMTRRRFVLRPLADLLPELILPGSTRLSVREALHALDPSADAGVSETVQRVEPMDDVPGWRVGLYQPERGTM